jgi:Flp pilus assembly pilin Flp
MTVKQQIRKFIEDKRGAGMAEYVILVAVIAILCIIAFQAFGGAVSGQANNQAGSIQGL